MDRFMHVVGLHGKSFIPLCLGFGCNVPSVIGTRIVESKKARLLTIFLAPFIPCTARLAVLTFVCAAVFAERASLVSWLLLTVNIVVLGVTGIAISRVFMKGEPMPFIMELPLYHKPDPRTIASVVWARTVSFVKRAGSVILLASVVIWLLSNIPSGRLETSVLAWVGRLLAPIGAPMGLGWREMVALVSSLVAKENSVATLGVLYGVGEEGLRQVLPHDDEPCVGGRVSHRAHAVCPVRGDGGGHEAGDGELAVVFLVFCVYAGGLVLRGGRGVSPGPGCRSVGHFALSLFFFVFSSLFFSLVGRPAPAFAGAMTIGKVA